MYDHKPLWSRMSDSLEISVKLTLKKTLSTLTCPVFDKLQNPLFYFDPTYTIFGFLTQCVLSETLYRP